MFEAKEVMGPITLLQGEKTEQAIELAAQLTARYSDSKDKQTTIIYGKDKPNKEISVNSIKQIMIKKFRIW